MRKSLIAVSALALLAGPALAEAQGRGRGGGDPHAQHGGQGGGQNGHGPRAERGNRGGGQERQARGNERRVERQAQRQERRGRQDDEMRGNGRARIEEARDHRHRGSARTDRRAERVIVEQGRRERNGPRLTQRRAVRIEQARDVVRLRWDPERVAVRGCPPGLARKYNGCLPPGQARQLAESQNWYRSWWSVPDRTNYSYDDGYLYRLGGDGRIASFVPLLGGSLWNGAAWPSDYQGYELDPYHTDYYGLNDGLDYRYADGAIFGVDPSNQLIQSIVALIAGDDWAVGQAMPAGYDLYNVPYDYRDQYADTPDAMYRYADGYVYEVDPTSRLVEAAIQLIS
jgi:hypothetical protein